MFDLSREDEIKLRPINIKYARKLHCLGFSAAKKNRHSLLCTKYDLMGIYHT